MSLRTAIALSLILAACTLRPYEFGDSATGTTGSTATTGTTAHGTGVSTLTGAATTGAATTDPGDATSTGPIDPTTGGGCDDFICPPDVPSPYQCSQWLQNCPEGQKCMPWSADGDSAWDSLKCVDIVPDPHGVDEPCNAFGSGVSGEDTCDLGLVCWDIDPDTGMGTCVAFCVGTPDSPKCAEPWTYCHITAEGIYTLCLPGCDPLVQDCAGDDLCIPNPQNPEAFICVLDASGEEGQAFDPCEYANACDKGLVCLDPSAAGECDPMVLGCCIPFCDTSLPNTCPGQGQECLPWYELDQAPPGHENIGVCALPMP